MQPDTLEFSVFQLFQVNLQFRLRMSVPLKPFLSKCLHPLLLLFLGCLTQATALGQNWPPGIGARIELSFAESDQAHNRVCAKIADFDQWSQIVPPGPLVRFVDQSGAPLKTFFVANKDGTRDLGFIATPTQRYFIEWPLNETATPASPQLPPKDIEAAADLNHLLDDASDNWPADVPIAAVIPLMRLRPTWTVDRNILREASGGLNSILMTKSSWSDFDLTIRLKPESQGYAGLIIRCKDAEFTGTNGLYWIMNALPKGQTQGSNVVHGMAKDDTPGPSLRAGEWNTLHVVAQGSRVLFHINGELCKTIELPAGTGLSGRVGLVGHRNRVEFSELRLTPLAGANSAKSSGFKEDFSGKSLDASHWEDIEGRPVRGYARVVNTGSSPASFGVRLQFHREPFAINSVPIGAQPLGPGRASAWFWPEGLLRKSRATAPYTVTASSIANATGRLEFSTALSDKQIVRSFDICKDSRAIAEVLWGSFSEPAQIVTPLEDGQKRLELVRAMNFAGKPPMRLCIGYAQGTPADFEAGRLLGFTAMHSTPQSFDIDSFRNLGYRYIYTFTHILTKPSMGNGYNTEQNQREIQAMADAWRKLGVADQVTRISLYDEALSNTADFWKTKASPHDMSKNPSAWLHILKTANLKPADFLPAGSDNPWEQNPETLDAKAWSSLKISSPTELETNRLGVNRALLLNSAIWPARLSGVSRAVHDAFGPGINTTVNIHSKQLLLLNFGFIDPWRLYGPEGVLDSPQICDYFVGYPLNSELLIDLQRSALLGADRPVDGYFAAQSSYLPTSARLLELRAISALAAGAKTLTYYEWGPRHNATENWYSDDVDRLASIGRVNHAAGWVEDILLDGRPPRGQVAIFVSPTSDRWESALPTAMNRQIERRQIHSLLRTLNYQADFIHESYLPMESELDAYRVIFLTDPCLASDAAQKLASWIDRGGTLFAVTSAGERDELARPGGILAKALGLGISHKTGLPQRVTLSTGGTVSIGAGAIAQPVLEGAQVLGAFEYGAPAILVKDIGKGQLIFFSFLPGNAFHLGSSFTRDGLFGLQDGVLDVVRPGLAAAGAPLCETNHRMVSARVIQSAQGCVVFLINRSNEKVDRLKVTLRLPGKQGFISLQHKQLPTRKESDGSITTELPLDTWDVLKVQ